MTRKLPLDSPDFPHGERRGYARGCRCDSCRAGNAKAQLELRRDRMRRSATEPVPHGLNGYVNWGCRCEICREAGRIDLRAARERRKGHPGTPHGTTSGYRFWGCRCEECRIAVQKARLALSVRHQAEAKARAHRHGAQWTGPELELASRRDLSTLDVAHMIGRSYWAVETMRRDLGKEPALAQVAGVSREAQ